jgi:hypothetical protein
MEVMVADIPGLKKSEWVRNTIAVAVSGWFLRILPSLFFIDTTQDNSYVDSSGPLIFI